LSEQVGGITTLQAIKMLNNDQATEVFLLVSKPPSKKVAEKILTAVKKTGKPAVICFLGSLLKNEDPNISFISTLEDASIRAVQLVEKSNKKPGINFSKYWKKYAQQSIKSLDSEQRYLRGLYSGGTLCYEAQQVLWPILGNIYSNSPLNKEFKLKDSNKSKRNSLIDLGEEEFTVGRLHPMIDASLRSERIMSEATKTDVGVILFDVILGYVASPDPAGDLLPAIKEAKPTRRKIKRTRSAGFSH